MTNCFFGTSWKTNIRGCIFQLLFMNCLEYENVHVNQILVEVGIASYSWGFLPEFSWGSSLINKGGRRGGASLLPQVGGASLLPHTTLYTRPQTIKQAIKQDDQSFISSYIDRFIKLPMSNKRITVLNKLT